MSLVTEIKQQIGKVQEKLQNNLEYHQVWLDLQSIWSKLASVDALETETVAAVNKKILDLLQEKESLENAMYIVVAKPTKRYSEICHDLKLLQELLKA